MTVKVHDGELIKAAVICAKLPDKALLKSKAQPVCDAQTKLKKVIVPKKNLQRVLESLVETQALYHETSRAYLS